MSKALIAMAMVILLISCQGPTGPTGAAGADGNSILFDNFLSSTLSTNWTQGSAGNYYAGGGSLTIAGASTGTTASTVKLQSSLISSNDYDVAVGVKITAGTVAMLCLRETGGSSQYRFGLDSSGNACIYLGPSTVLKAWTKPANTVAGSDTLLEAVAIGGHLSFIINGVLFAEVNDATLSSGSVSLLVNTSTTAAFRNFVMTFFKSTQL